MRNESDYQFQVVCMTVKITTTETHRDAATYTLSCTAEVSGGTAPYTYDWSGNVGDLLSGQGTATIEVEIPINNSGSIGVSVADSGNPPCTASAEFNVCALICSFNATLGSAPPAGQTGPYVYECEADVDGGTGPFTYEWSPSPETLIEPDGRKVRISVPDDTRRQINLTVKDNNDCQAVNTQKVGTIGYTLEADPSDGTGTLHGERENAHFDVELTATADETIPHAPYSLALEFKRPATGEVYELTLDLEPNSSPTKYVGTWGDLTTMKGKWEIKVKNGRSNTLTFKIDKRQQIVQLAQHWASQGLLTRFYPPSAAPGDSVLFGECSSFVGYIYNRLGLNSIGYDPSGNVCSLGDAATSTNTQDGDIRVYAGGGHYAIVAGGGMIDNNNGAYTDPAIIGSPGPTQRQLDDSATLNIYSAPPPTSKSLPELNEIDAE